MYWYYKFINTNHQMYKENHYIEYSFWYNWLNASYYYDTYTVSLTRITHDKYLDLVISWQKILQLNNVDCYIDCCLTYKNNINKKVVVLYIDYKDGPSYDYYNVEGNTELYISNRMQIIRKW